MGPLVYYGFELRDVGFCRPSLFPSPWCEVTASTGIPIFKTSSNKSSHIWRLLRPLIRPFSVSHKRKIFWLGTYLSSDEVRIGDNRIYSLLWYSWSNEVVLAKLRTVEIRADTYFEMVNQVLVMQVQLSSILPPSLKPHKKEVQWFCMRFWIEPNVWLD